MFNDDRERPDKREEAIDKMFMERDMMDLGRNDIAESYDFDWHQKVIEKIEHDFTQSYLNRVEVNVLSARDMLLETNHALQKNQRHRWMASEVSDIIMRMDETLDRIAKLKGDI